MDNIPPEVRVMIFRLVLSTKCGAAKKGSRSTTQPCVMDPTINTSLFRVNRLISEESQDAFYQENTICFTDSTSVSHGSGNLRRLKIAGKLASNACNGRWALGQNTRMLARLPKLQNITLVCDSLDRNITSLRAFATRTVGGCEIRCLALGTFEVALPFVSETPAYLSHHTDALPTAKELAAQHSLASLADRCRADPAPAISIAQCLKHHEVGGTRSEDFARDVSIEDVKCYLRHAPAFMPPEDSRLSTIYKDLPRGAKLRNLTVEEHGAELVEWASELLAFSVGALTQHLLD